MAPMSCSPVVHPEVTSVMVGLCFSLQTGRRISGPALQELSLGLLVTSQPLEFWNECFQLPHYTHLFSRGHCFSKVVRQELGAGDKQGGSGRWCWDEKVAGSCHVRESATSLDYSGASAIRNPVWAGRR